MDSTRIRCIHCKSPSFTKVLEVAKSYQNYSFHLNYFYPLWLQKNLETTMTAMKLGVFVVPTYA